MCNHLASWMDSDSRDRMTIVNEKEVETEETIFCMFLPRSVKGINVSPVLNSNRLPKASFGMDSADSNQNQKHFLLPNAPQIYWW